MPVSGLKAIIIFTIAGMGCCAAMGQTSQPTASAPASTTELSLHDVFEQIDLGRYTQAYEILEQIKSKNDDNPYYYFALGRIAQGNKRYALAITAYGVALKLKPDLTEASFRIAISQACSGSAKEAVTRLDELIKNNPTDQRYHYAKSLILMQTKEYDQAKTAMEQACQIDGKFISSVEKKADAVIHYRDNEAASAKKRAEEIDKIKAKHSVILEALNKSKGTLQESQNEKTVLQAKYEGELTAIKQAYDDIMLKAMALYKKQSPPEAMQISNPAGYAAAQSAADAQLARTQAAAIQTRNTATAALQKKYQPLAAAVVTKIKKYEGIVATQAKEEKLEQAKVAAAEKAEKAYKPQPPFDIITSLRDIPPSVDSSTTSMPTSMPTTMPSS